MADWRAIHVVVLLLVAGFALMGFSNLILSQKLEDEMAKIMQMPLPYLVCTAVGALTIVLLAAKMLVVAVQYLYLGIVLFAMWRGGDAI